MKEQEILNEQEYLSKEIREIKYLRSRFGGDFMSWAILMSVLIFKADRSRDDQKNNDREREKENERMRNDE